MRTYNRNAAVAYAKRWYNERNPEYYDFEQLGGDCTNFISQCLYAGAGEMNWTPDTGWYYASLNNRSPSWSAVEYLHTFLVNNTGDGPRGHEAALQVAEIGDIVQLSFDGIVYSHSLLVIETGFSPTKQNTLVAAHTYNAVDRPISSYMFQSMRLIHISDEVGQ